MVGALGNLHCKWKMAVLALAQPAPLVAAETCHVVAAFVFLDAHVALRTPRHVVLGGPVHELLVKVIFAVAAVPLLLADEAKLVSVWSLDLRFPVRPFDPEPTVGSRTPLLRLVEVHFDVFFELGVLVEQIFVYNDFANVCVLVFDVTIKLCTFVVNNFAVFDGDL